MSFPNEVRIQYVLTADSARGSNPEQLKDDLADWIQKATKAVPLPDSVQEHTGRPDDPDSEVQHGPSEIFAVTTETDRQ